MRRLFASSAGCVVFSASTTTYAALSRYHTASVLWSAARYCSSDSSPSSLTSPSVADIREACTTLDMTSMAGPTTLVEVQKAYHHMAKLHHPDAAPSVSSSSSPAAMARVNRARDVLRRHLATSGGTMNNISSGREHWREQWQSKSHKQAAKSTRKPPHKAKPQKQDDDGASDAAPARWLQHQVISLANRYPPYIHNTVIYIKPEN